MASIVITFNEDFQQYYRLGYTYVNPDTGANEYTAFGWRDTIDNTMQVLVATPTSVVGEATAINFVDALLNNMPTQQAQDITVTRLNNVVTIEVLVGTPTFSNSWAYQCFYPCEDVASVNFVVDNVTPTIDPSASPEIISLPEINYLNIDIIDTQDNDRVLLLEKTEIKSPKLVYNGSDDKFQTLMTSELRFNMLVSNAEDAKFLHLFTSDEERYKVVLSEVTDELNPVVIWQGFLLPEQFNEPYENGCFFIEFIATDGVGRLKGVYLSDDYYIGEKTVADLLNSTLLMTGLDLELHYAPGIKNALVDLKLSDIAINTLCYNEKGKLKTTYFILEKIVNMLGCKLFQSNNVWYLIAVSRIADVDLLLEKYINGYYVGVANLLRPTKKTIFSATPTIYKDVRLRAVNVEWDYVETELTPVDLIDQSFNKNTNVFSINHWRIVGAVFTSINPSIVSGDVSNPAYDEHFYMVLTGEKWDDVFLSDYYLYSVHEYLDYARVFKLNTDVFKFGVNGWVYDNTDKYVEITKAFFVRGDLYGDRYISFELELIGWLSYNSIAASDINPFEYELLLNGEILLSNTGLGSMTNTLMQTANVKSVIKVDKLPIYEDGYITFRFYAPKYIDNSTGILKTKKTVINKLLIKSHDTFEGFSKVRNIKSSKTIDLNLFHLDERIPYSLSSLVVSKDYIFSPIEIDIPQVSIQIPVLDYSSDNISYTVYYSGGGAGGSYVVNYLKTFFEISRDDYFFLKEEVEKDQIKLKREGLIIDIDFVFSIVTSPNTDPFVKYYFQTIEYGTSISPKFNSLDELWVVKEAFTEYVDNKQYLIDKWSRYEVSENIRWFDVLSQNYHGSFASECMKIEGEVLSLIFPLDVLMFEYYFSNKYYTSMRLTLYLAEGTTGVLMIENKQENVTDYI